MCAGLGEVGRGNDTIRYPSSLPANGLSFFWKGKGPTGASISHAIPGPWRRCLVRHAGSLQESATTAERSASLCGPMWRL